MDAPKNTGCIQEAPSGNQKERKKTENNLPDRDKWQPTLKVYQRRKGVSSKAQALIWHSLDDNGLSWDLI